MALKGTKRKRQSDDDDSSYKSPTKSWFQSSKRNTKQPPRKKVARVANPHLKKKRDPLRVVDDDVFALINSHFSATDTELLRRVSHQFKAASEHYNKIAAIRQHFPWATFTPAEVDTDQKANLTFRRNLYNFESMKRGHATRATLFEGVHVWGLTGHTLALVRRESIEILDLRSRKSEILLEWEKCECEAQRVQHCHCPERRMSAVTHITTLPGGDVIIAYNTVIDEYEHDFALRTKTANTVRFTSRRHFWAGFWSTRNMARLGEFSWRHEALNAQLAVVVGTNAIYSIEQLKQNRHFVSRSLDTGQLLTSCAMDVAHEHVIGLDWTCPIQLTLSGDENVAICSGMMTNPSTSLAVPILFSTTDGTMVKRELNLRFIAGGTVVPSIISNAFVEIVPRKDDHDDPQMYSTTWTNASGPFVREAVGQARGKCARGLDIDRGLAMKMVQSGCARWPRDPFVKLSVLANFVSTPEPSQTETDGESETISEESKASRGHFSLVTLPRRAGDPERRPLEVDFTDSNEPRNGVQSKNGYLIFHGKDDHELLVADFWPSW